MLGLPSAFHTNQLDSVLYERGRDDIKTRGGLYVHPRNVVTSHGMQFVCVRHLKHIRFGYPPRLGHLPELDRRRGGVAAHRDG